MWSSRGRLSFVWLLMAGCSPPQAPDPGFQVALLTPGPVTDAGWNSAAHDGLKLIESELGARVSHLETRTPAEFERGFRTFASQGYDLVFGHGYEFQDAAAEVADEHPDTVFITTSGSTLRPNLAPMVFRLEQATYVLGALAALSSRTGKLGVVGGVELPSVASTFMAFAGGAREHDPDVEILTTYVGSWEDVSAAKEAALAQIRQGADFIIHNADAAGLGVFQAALESQGRVLVFGTNKNQNEVAPSVVAASAVLDIPRCFKLVAERVRDGSFVARPMEFGMADGVVTYEPNSRLLQRFDAATHSRIETLIGAIRSGRLQVPQLEF